MFRTLPNIFAKRSILYALHGSEYVCVLCFALFERSRACLCNMTPRLSSVQLWFYYKFLLSNWFSPKQYHNLQKDYNFTLQISDRQNV